MAGILHRWDDEDGLPALQIDAAGRAYFGDANEAILTKEGGLAVWFQNRTGAPSVRGMLVTLDLHNKEIGHCIDTVPGGSDVLARVVLHFN